jgi:flagellar basal body rod protein FlgG
MNVSMYQAAAALNANSRWQEVIAQNLAASSVPGYKAQELSVEAVRSGVMPAGSLNSPNAPQFFTLPKATATTNFQGGDMQFVGDKYDVAIQGNAFIEVRMPNNKIALTRDGEFHVNAKGQLVTREGYSVMSAEGPIQLDLNSGAQINISPNGDVSQGENTVGTIKMDEYDHPNLLTQLGGGYYAANNVKLHKLATASTLREGYLEESNSSVVKEMADMITAQRGFEANTHIIQIQDDRLGKVISELGNPT